MIRSILQIGDSSVPGLTPIVRSPYDVSWGHLQASHNAPFDWTNVDKWLAFCASIGGEPLFTFGVDMFGPNMPLWACSKGTAAPTDDPQFWVEYVYNMVGYLKGKCRYYSLWNEPDMPSFFSGTVEQLATMQNVVYEALIHIPQNSENTLIGGNVVSLTNEGIGAQFLSRLLASSNHMTAVGIHLYITSLAQLDLVPEMLQNARVIANLSGLEAAPLFITEMGYEGAPGSPTFTQLSDDVQTYIMRTMFSYCEDAGATAALWYAAGHHDFAPSLASSKASLLA